MMKNFGYIGPTQSKRKAFFTAEGNRIPEDSKAAGEVKSDFIENWNNSAFNKCKQNTKITKLGDPRRIKSFNLDNFLDYLSRK